MDSFQRHLAAASGFLTLGMLDDAANELEEISPALKCTPEVIALRVEIYRAASKWGEMAMLSRHLVKMRPDDSSAWLALAFAVRRAESPEAELAVLRDADKAVPSCAAVKYALACSASLCGLVSVAKGYLEECFGLDSSLRLQALDDEDLSALWDSPGAS